MRHPETTPAHRDAHPDRGGRGRPGAGARRRRHEPRRRPRRTRTSKSQLFHYFPGGKSELVVRSRLSERAGAGRAASTPRQARHLDAWEGWRDAAVRTTEPSDHLACPIGALNDGVWRRRASAHMDRWFTYLAGGRPRRPHRARDLRRAAGRAAADARGEQSLAPLEAALDGALTILRSALTAPARPSRRGRRPRRGAARAGLASGKRAAICGAIAPSRSRTSTWVEVLAQGARKRRGRRRPAQRLKKRRAAAVGQQVPHRQLASSLSTGSRGLPGTSRGRRCRRRRACRRGPACSTSPRCPGRRRGRTPRRRRRGRARARGRAILSW